MLSRSLYASYKYSLNNICAIFSREWKNEQFQSQDATRKTVCIFLWSFHSNKSNQSGIHRKIKKKKIKK